MDRPRVVVSVGASADGKVALTRDGVLMRQPSSDIWAAMRPEDADGLPVDVLELIKKQYGCNAVLEGSGSLVEENAEPDPLPPVGADVDHDQLYRHHLPAERTRQPSPPHMWFTTVDGRGRVRWVEEHENWDILVLACRSTPADYLGYLQRERICYLIAGDDRVDLAAAIAAMGTELGISCVLSTAGGGLNGALLRNGLVDELHLSLFPSLVGGLGTPSIMDGTPLGLGESPTPLRLLSVHTDAAGTVRLHYDVVRRAHQPAGSGRPSS
jgi:riboflavin biosynthesis pyrimidine reductase